VQPVAAHHPQSLPGSAFIEALLAQGRREGLEPELLLARAGFPFDPIRGASPARCFSPRLYSRLAGVVFRALDDEAGGSMPDGPTPWGSTRLLAFGVLGCPHLEAALRRGIEFNRCCRLSRSLQVDNSLHVDRELRLASLSYYAPGDAWAQQRLLCGLAIWLRFCGWLIGQQIDITAAGCAAPGPSPEPELRHFFACPVTFGETVNWVSFSARHLEAGLLRKEEELDAFMREAPYHLIVAPGPCVESITHRIRQLLGDDFRDELPSFEALTVLLNMSARTLRRRLEREGTSYQRIKDNARRDAAIDLLKSGRMTVSEVAERVGFSDPSAFHRSFKKWTGESPGSFRPGD